LVPFPTPITTRRDYGGSEIQMKHIYSNVHFLCVGTVLSCIYELVHFLCSGIISVKFAIFRGRGFTHVCVDHRPTKVLVSGYEEDEKTEVLAHFAVSPTYVCLINLSYQFLCHNF
jgi:hypothetical protein